MSLQSDLKGVFNYKIIIYKIEMNNSSQQKVIE